MIIHNTRIYLIIQFIALLLASAVSLGAQWPTIPDSALFVDYGLYPYLAVDDQEESIIVIYIANADQLKAKKYDRYGYPLWGGSAVVLADTINMFGLNLSNLPSQWGAVVSDDSGGTIVCWQDYRNSTFDWMDNPENNEIYIQRVDVNGQVRFGINGRRISTPASEGWHSLGNMKRDYHSGFVVGYSDFYSSMSHCRRFDISGELLWEKTYNGGYFDVNATDIDGNIFISFGSNNRRQKLDLFGNELWPDTLVGAIPSGDAFSDNIGGVIGGGFFYPDSIKINRVDSSGQFVFGDNGISWAGVSSFVHNAPDGTGGIFVSWNSNNVKLQRITKYGIVVFDPSGLSLCPYGDCGNNSEIVTDDENGVISIWSGKIVDNIHTLYAQRVDSIGQLLWDSSGVEFHSTSDMFFAFPVRTTYSDRRGGAFYVWIEQGQGLRIMLKQISRYGNLGEVLASIEDNNKLPQFLRLDQNYPNPFNNFTIIRYTLNQPDFISLELYNILGERVKTLLNGYLTAGEYRIHFDASHLPSGILIYRLQTSRDNEMRKMLLIK